MYHYLAAAAMTAVLMTGQVYPVLAEIGNIEANLETSSLIPDNVTIDQPAALSQVALPKERLRNSFLGGWNLRTG